MYLCSLKVFVRNCFLFAPFGFDELHLLSSHSDFERQPDINKSIITETSFSSFSGHLNFRARSDDTGGRQRYRSTPIFSRRHVVIKENEGSWGNIQQSSLTEPSISQQPSAV